MSGFAGLSTHVLDTMRGQPGADLVVELFRVEGEATMIVAHSGEITPFSLAPVPLRRDWVSGCAILDRRTIHVEDVQADAAAEYTFTRQLAAASGVRTHLATPLLSQGAAIGAILVVRRAVRGFTANQVALLETFADQAVIAIENARLFSELEQRNAELQESHRQVTEALEQQTATAEVLKVISSSPVELQTVLDTLVENAVRLCRAHVGTMYRFDG